MFEDNNLALFFFSIIPALLYTTVIARKIPDGHLKLRAIIGYILIGMLSPIFVYAIYFIFPNWGHQIQYDYLNYQVDYTSKTITYTPTTLSLLFNIFIQISFLEECCKWISCKLTNVVRGSWEKTDSPIATMFYYCMVSAGFSIVENIAYVTKGMNNFFNGQTPQVILIERSISSVIIHMVCGLFMGYFIALSKQYRKTKKTFYILYGIGAAAILHGIYDFNLMSSGRKEYFSINDKISFHIENTQIIILSLILAYFMRSHLLAIKHAIKEEHLTINN